MIRLIDLSEPSSFIYIDWICTLSLCTSGVKNIFKRHFALSFTRQVKLCIWTGESPMQTSHLLEFQICFFTFSLRF